MAQDGNNERQSQSPQPIRKSSLPPENSPEHVLARIIGQRISQGEGQEAAQARRILEELGYGEGQDVGRNEETMARLERPHDKRSRKEVVSSRYAERLDPEAETLNTLPDEEMDEEAEEGGGREPRFEIPRDFPASLKTELRVLNGMMALDFDDLKEANERILRLEDRSPDFADQKQAVLKQLSREFQRLREARGDQAVERFGFYLETDDLRSLDVSPMAWLDKQFDQIYSFAKAGNELDSPVLQRVQTEVSEASAYLQKRYGKFEKEKIQDQVQATQARENARNLEEFNTNFTVRLNLIYSRGAVELRGMEQIQGAVNRLRTTGLMGSLAFDDGRVGAMFNRMQPLLNHLRLSEGGREHHLNPESLNRLQSKLIEEQFRLAKEGLGVFAQKYKDLRNEPQEDSLSKREYTADDLLKNEITRSVRTAYDALVISQRVAIIAGRGKALGDRRQYFSDNGAAFGVFNLEEFSINKWELFNMEEGHFFDFIKLDMALHNDKKIDVSGMTRSQLLDLGARLFRDMYAVPDFFSSSWRMTGLREQLMRVTKYKAENDKMIEKLVDDPRWDNDPAHKIAKEEINSIGVDIRSRIGERFSAWDRATPARDRLPGDEAIEKRRIAREIFSKGLSREQRDLCLQVLNGNDIKDIIEETARIAGTKDGDEVGDFALFIQLRQNLGHFETEGDDYKASPERKKNHRERVWKKIQKYRTEDIIEIIRSRANGSLYAEDEQNLKILNDLFIINDRSLYVNPNTLTIEQQLAIKKGGLEGSHSYDRFQGKYGPVIQMIREDAMKGLKGSEQVNFSNLSERHKAMVDRLLGNGSGKVLEKIYKDMNTFINGRNITSQFMGDSGNYKKFFDLYNRVITVDDVFLSELQEVPANSGLQSASEYWTGETGGDPLKRNLTDIGNAINGGNSFIKFMQTEAKDEKFKEAKTMKVSVEAYNGRGNGAEVMRFTYGSELLYAEQDYWVNVLRLGALPLRQPTSQKQKDYGIGAKSMTRAEIREDLDHHKTEFVGRGSNAYKWFTQMEKLTETDNKGRMVMSGLTLLIYLSLGLIVGVPVGAAAEAVRGTSK